MVCLSVHRVTKIDVSGVGSLQTGSSTISIVIESEDGTFELSLFAEKRENLALQLGDRR